MTSDLFRTIRLAGSAALAAFILTASAGAQGFNVDFDDFLLPLPPTSSSYAAAGTAGVWNSVTIGAGANALVNKSGASTGVTLTLSAGLNLDVYFDNANMSGEDANLLEDFIYGSASEFITVAGLADGTYDVLTYAIAPDAKTSFLTAVTVVGSTDPLQAVGGSPWAGNHTQGGSYAKHRVTVSGGAAVRIDVAVNLGFMSVNGLQIELAGPTGTAYCFGDGSGQVCPCASFGGAGEGCLTTSGTGATLSASGAANVLVDSLTLSVTGAPANKPGLFFQGNNQIGNPAGDGLLCAAGATIRYAVNPTDASGAASQAGFAVNASAGQTLNYQYWFRDTGNPCGGGFNFTNGWNQPWN